MDNLPGWLAAAVDAAGVCTVYNADDWIVMTRTDPAGDSEPGTPESPRISH